jgi:hypothetical protein
MHKITVTAALCGRALTGSKRTIPPLVNHFEEYPAWMIAHLQLGAKAIAHRNGHTFLQRSLPPKLLFF